MEFTGKLKKAWFNFESGEYEVTFTMNEKKALESLNELADKKLNISAVIYRKLRSVNANRLLWNCIGELSQKTNEDRWSIYMRLLRDHGVGQVITIEECNIDKMRSQWRECVAIEQPYIKDGVKVVDMLCFYGSHTYNAEEFSKLIDAAIQDMINLGLQPPKADLLGRLLAEWQRD